jgi:A/G-specific adenine glycosylase
MLQQTQAARVVEPYRAFLERFPTVRALAAARPADVIRRWSGLGYNRRAIALADAARAIVWQHGGRIPSDPETLRTLPGVGPYTSAAVASLGHGRAVALVDTNVRRVLSRASLAADPADVRRASVDTAAQIWLDTERPAEWNQALMDLGREICRPVPRCTACPIRTACRSAGAVAPSTGRRRQTAFEGSFRQLRGRVVRLLSSGEGTTLSVLSRRAEAPLGRVTEAAAALAADGLVQAGPLALRGAPGGRVRLAL